MDIIGVDAVTLALHDVEAGRQYLRDFGLAELRAGDAGADFEALDGSGLKVRHWDDLTLPPAVCAPPNLRETVWGVRDEATLAAIEAELAKDRPVQRGPDGIVRSTDEDGYPIGFQLTVRRALPHEPSLVNVPGMPPMRKANVVADYDSPVEPMTLAHHVFYTLDMARAEAFYVKRLGFRTTDRFTGTGVFLRSAGCADHHNLYLIQRPGTPLGLNHIAFHVRDHLQLMIAGQQFMAKGGQSAWGPGRHIFGSNHFWYFKSPFGGNIEYDADIDVVDDDWVPRETEIGPKAAAVWLVDKLGH
jgi:catechol 2,3-dioxygenase-like lactoylglutathione lyase family enzyme